MNQSALYPHEWFAIALFTTLFAFLSLLSWLNGGIDHLEVSFEDQENTYLAYVSGFVENPGCYRIKKGSLVKELLDKACPMKGADLRLVDMQKPVYEGIKLRIKAVEMIPVTLEYKPHPEKKSVLLPKNTKVSELPEILGLNHEEERIEIDKRKKIIRKNDNIIIEKCSFESKNNKIQQKKGKREKPL